MKRHILVVEDDGDIRENMIEFLEGEGYQVTAAPDGLAALQYLRQSNDIPQLILLDLMMPRMDGFAFRREQEMDPKLSAIPVVLMSADPQVEVQRHRLGAMGLVKKPIDIDELSELLDRLIFKRVG